MHEIEADRPILSRRYTGTPRYMGERKLLCIWITSLMLALIDNDIISSLFSLLACIVILVFLGCVRDGANMWKRGGGGGRKRMNRAFSQDVWYALCAHEFGEEMLQIQTEEPNKVFWIATIVTGLKTAGNVESEDHHNKDILGWKTPSPPTWVNLPNRDSIQ